MGIEPTYPAWKAGVLPLNYTRMKRYICLLKRETLTAQSRNRTSDTRIFSPLLYQLSYLGQPYQPEYLSSWYGMGGGGFEPPKQVAADLQSVPFGHSGIHPYHSDILK